MLTPEEAASLKAQQNAVVDSFTSTSPGPSPGPSPSPTPTPPPSDYKKLEWPAEGYTRIKTNSPAKLYVQVPMWEETGMGRFQLAPVTGAGDYFRSMKISTTPGGPAIPFAEVAQSKTCPIAYAIGSAVHGLAYLEKGVTYYIDIGEVDFPPEADHQVWVDLYAP